MLITPAYQALQTGFHNETPEYGTSGSRHSEAVAGFCQKLGSKDVLDYGCGKATLQKGLPFPIQNYDPCRDEYNARPVPATLVVCTDVLEHIELSCLGEVLEDLRRLTKQVLFINVACRPAKKTLPDGRNAHLIQEDPNWWLGWLLPKFDLQSFQTGNGEFTALLTPKKNADA